MILIVNFIVFLSVFAVASCRIHKLVLMDDTRRYVDLTTFGFYKEGILEVHVVNLKLSSTQATGEYGFTLDRTVNDAINPYLEPNSDKCFLKDSGSSIMTSALHKSIIFLKMDFDNMRLIVTCKGEVTDLHLYQNRSLIWQNSDTKQSSYIFPNRKKRNIDKNISTNVAAKECSHAVLPITKKTHNEFNYYNTSFAMYVSSEKEEGFYSLYFHNCPGFQQKIFPINVMIDIYESNGGNFLSAGEMPLPALYSLMSLIFFLCAGFWTFILKTSRHPVYRIHIIMCILCYLKALSLAFHGINYHFIQIRGEHVTAWAILYYITHLLKGAVLFVTIVLVGTGWNFIKHILADRDKKLFMIVIPLQVVANVAEIIIAESEEGAVEYKAWKYIFIFIDFLCCGAIMFPIVWSIRHLQDASTTDGKAAINLEKLKLFRQFYIMVICYIYFTRFVVYILKISVAFQYSAIDETFREMATLVFFVMTGYKFRPAAANPYFTPSQLDDIEPMILSDIGVLEGVTKIAHRGDRSQEDTQPLMQEHTYDSD